MKFLVCCLGIISHSLCVVNSRKSNESPTSLISVSRFQGVEKYYLQLKNTVAENNQFISVSPKEDTLARRKMCKVIFRSNYFQFKQEIPVNVNDIRAKNELKLRYADAYQTLFTEYRAIARLPVRRMYDNPYKLRTVLVPGHAAPLKEYMFLCPVRELVTGAIKEYYVSAKYNVNGAKHSNATHISGRFLFLRNRKTDRLHVHALAEQPSAMLLTFDIDLMYFLRKGYNLPIEKAKDDPICRLSDVEKLRLCTALFSSERYRGRVQFIPSMDSVDVNCEKREIRFFIDVPRYHVNDTFYREWMITCKAMTVRKGKWVNFYVSRGYGPNRIFVYKLFKGQVVLYHHSVNVGAVKE